MRIRPSKLSVLMNIAENMAELSHDEQTQVGAVLVKNTNGAMIASGYNGFVRGAPDDELPCTRPDKYTYILHAEENMLLNCAMNGIAVDNTFVICTMSPCVHCIRMLFNAGVTRVIVKNKYTDFDNIMSMKDIRIEQSITPEGFIELKLERCR